MGNVKQILGKNQHEIPSEVRHTRDNQKLHASDGRRMLANGKQAGVPICGLERSYTSCCLSDRWLLHCKISRRNGCPRAAPLMEWNFPGLSESLGQIKGIISLLLDVISPLASLFMNALFSGTSGCPGLRPAGRYCLFSR